MAIKTVYLLLLAVPVLCVRPPRDYLLRTSPIQEPVIHTQAQGQLILTEYLEAGKIEEAQNLSRVQGGAFPEDIPSYSGFFTIDKTNGSNTFFWFFPAEHDHQNAPVVLWLQGGPGSSSLWGLFKELGPFFVAVNDSAKLVRNPYSWHKNHSLLFIDNPVGVGFSFTNSSYPSDQTWIGNDLYSAVKQFFQLFPNFRTNDFFIAGESYAGKYVPALGHTIHQNNPNASVKINLKGLIIGDGLTDPVNQLDYSDYVYQVGLVDNSTWKEMKTHEEQIRQLIKDGNFYDAFEGWLKTTNVFATNSGLGYYNILSVDGDGDTDSKTGDYVHFLELNSTRKALHVGSAAYNQSNSLVFAALEEDMMKSVAPWVEELLDAGYRVVFYNGQLDVIVGYTLSENMFRHLKFKDADKYLTAERNQWGNSSHVFGYTKTAGGLTEVLVRNAGHMVPADQTAVAFDLVYRATRNKF